MFLPSCNCFPEMNRFRREDLPGARCPENAAIFTPGVRSMTEQNAALLDLSMKSILFHNPGSCPDPKN